MMRLSIGRTNRVNGRGVRMARRPRGHEKINMDKKRFGYFPERFTWRGRQYCVRAVERCWMVSRRRLGHRVDRLCFRLHGAAAKGWSNGSSQVVLEGTFDVYQDLNTNTWHLEKVVARA
jgi:hypothetical protein